MSDYYKNDFDSKKFNLSDMTYDMTYLECKVKADPELQDLVNEVFNKVLGFGVRSEDPLTDVAPQLNIAKIQELHKHNVVELKAKDENLIVTFTQGGLINDKNHGAALDNILRKFDGFCDLICNVVLCDDLLDQETSEGFNHLREIVNIDRLNEEKVIKSHLLSVYSIKEKLVAYFFSVYPQNIFSIKNQWNLVTKTKGKYQVNQDVLKKGLTEVGVGETLKVEVFNKGRFSLVGHSTLVKKTGEDEFIFFDPNQGEFRKLTLEKLTDKLNEQLEMHKGSDIYFIRGKDFKKRLLDKKVMDCFNKTVS